MRSSTRSKIRKGSKYGVRNHDGVFIIIGKSYLLGMPAVVVKRKYKREFITIAIKDLIEIRNDGTKYFPDVTLDGST
jgi:hypothetical protein